MTSTVNSTSNIWWIGPLVLTLLRLLQSEAKLARAGERDGVLIFRTGLAGRILGGAGVTGFSVLLLLNIGKEETWLLIVAALLIILGCLAWPAVITIGNHGITWHVWWRRLLYIPWPEVTGIERNAGGEIQVFGSNGQCINFTRFHVAACRFEAEVKRRAGLKETLHSSAVPTIR